MSERVFRIEYRGRLESRAIGVPMLVRALRDLARHRLRPGEITVLEVHDAELRELDAAEVKRLLE